MRRSRPRAGGRKAQRERLMGAAGPDLPRRPTPALSDRRDAPPPGGRDRPVAPRWGLHGVAPAPGRRPVDDPNGPAGPGLPAAEARGSDPPRHAPPRPDPPAEERAAFARAPEGGLGAGPARQARLDRPRTGRARWTRGLIGSSSPCAGAGVAGGLASLDQASLQAEEMGADREPGERFGGDRPARLRIQGWTARCGWAWTSPRRPRPRPTVWATEERGAALGGGCGRPRGAGLLRTRADGTAGRPARGGTVRRRRRFPDQRRMLANLHGKPWNEDLPRVRRGGSVGGGPGTDDLGALRSPCDRRGWRHRGSARGVRSDGREGIVPIRPTFRGPGTRRYVPTWSDHGLLLRELRPRRKAASDHSRGYVAGADGPVSATSDAVAIAGIGPVGPSAVRPGAGTLPGCAGPGRRIRRAPAHGLRIAGGAGGYTCLGCERSGVPRYPRRRRPGVPFVHRRPLAGGRGGRRHPRRA